MKAAILLASSPDSEGEGDDGACALSRIGI